MAPRNLVSLERAALDFGKGAVLADVSLGIAVGERIGIVGRNGGGKSTLLRTLAGRQSLDSGRRAAAADLRIGLLSQLDDFSENATARSVILAGQSTHSWATQSSTREILSELLGGYSDQILDQPVAAMSGGQRRRVALAALLISELDLLLLDEPTNHLDVEGVAWLAGHLRSRSDLAVAVITHDRWFLDEVSDETWEVVDGAVEAYEGGYSAFVLSKMERQRQASASEARRNNLLRKELAWLRRGAPARTSKPKFRIDAANQLIANEPPPRDDVELLAFANSRLGKTVFELHDADIQVGGRPVLQRITWNVGPGQRIGLVGINGAGKTTLLRTLAGELPVVAGKFVKGSTVKTAYLSQHLEELNPTWRVLEAVERVALRVELGRGRELTASQLCERLGFGADAQWTPVGDLSGGERRRLQLTRLLMSEPNVLMLDEPTNDFDVETLTALEDLLDSFAGTILVVSHDRYFLERVCDQFVGLLGDGQLMDLPTGVDGYLKLRTQQLAQTATEAVTNTQPVGAAAKSRETKKELARIERQLAKLEAAQAKLHEAMAAAANDYPKLAELDESHRQLLAEVAALEEQWLSLAGD